MNTPHTLFPERIYSLDVLRGIAALCVVFWHWQHFFYVGDSAKDFNGFGQPLFDIFALAYQYGQLAVELFFCISGFVFFWLFSQKISNRTLSASRFFMDRFSRLYPLHFVTFIGVAVLQVCYASSHTTYFVYQQNDLYHAVLNLLLVPAWGFETGWSFNAPIWSVSVELMLYAIMFVTCLPRQLRYLIIPCLIVLGYYVYPSHYKLGSGIFTFFCGGVAFIFMDRLMKLVGVKCFLVIAALFVTAAWLFVLLSQTLNMYFLMGVAFPALVILFASISCAFPAFLRPLAAVGDISYSSYLLHFPLQIIFAMVVDSMGGQRDIFYSTWMLALFMAVLIPLSYGCHYFFEVPMQRLLRQAFGKYKIPATSS